MWLLKIQKRSWRRTFVLTLMLFVTITFNGLTQDRCGLVEYNQLLQKRNLRHENDSTFEQWLNKSLSERMFHTREAEATLKIPVVVHVVHKGEPIGNGSNISDEQIASQIKVLNNDFRRLNADTTQTPESFRSVAGKLNIEFVLAKQTPDGLPTDGILRTRGTKDRWTINDDETLKALSYWPAEDYLNIWVTDLATSLIGYAQFPVSTLPGLDDAVNNRMTDGVVVDYMAFGSIDDGNFDLYTNYNKGRAATHEVGHFFGLRHIWGDDNGACGGNGDYVADTPDQTDKTSGCPSHPYATCTSQTMFQNFMDYTNDPCMNIFTQGQVARIETVLENSPRRKSLTSSPGLVVPDPLDNDLGIAEIISPVTRSCSNIIIPVVRVRNNGANTVSSALLTISIDDQVIETRTINFNPALELSQTTEVSFNEVIRDPGNYNLTFEIMETNNTADAKSNDNKKNIDVAIAHNISLPMKEPFDTFPSAWSIEDPDQSNTWTITGARHTGSDNKSIYMNFYEYEEGIGERDILLTPVFDLTNAVNPYLIFDVAYASYQNKQDGLVVYVVSDCSAAEQGVEIYSRYGSALATVTASGTAAFVPSGPGDWRSEVIDLSRFIGRRNVQIAFTAINDWGNNLFLDNVRIVGSLSEDVAIQKVNNPSPVHCNHEVQPSLTIENEGNVSITSLTIAYSLNDGEIQTFIVSDGLNLLPGNVTDITLPMVALPDGENTISFEAREPNGFADIYPEDNRMELKTIFDTDTDKIPFRENFDNEEWRERWNTLNPLGDTSWEVTETNFNRSFYFNAFNNTSEGDQAWLVSPVLDFSDASAASVFFDISYRQRNSNSDKFQVLASRNCGLTYEEILFEGSGEAISGGDEVAAWRPSEITHWKQKYLNLNTFVGEGQVRFAFVFTNRNGNNFYLDNIEFFVSDNAAPIRQENLYALYGNDGGNPDDFYLTFNLESKQSVAYEVIDAMGKCIAKQELQDVLNQTFRIEYANASTGIYIVRLLIGGKYYFDRIYLGQ